MFIKQYKDIYFFKSEEAMNNRQMYFVRSSISTRKQIEVGTFDIVTGHLYLIVTYRKKFPCFNLDFVLLSSTK